MAQSTATKIYVKAWAILLLLLFATWGFSRLDLNPFNTAIALTIAIAKAVLILLFFMHLRASRSLPRVFICAGFLWLVIMVELTMSDYLSRGR